MHDQFSVIGNFTFARTQPREWRDIPFAGERKLSRTVLRTIGVVLIYAAVFGVALWSIAQQVRA